MYTGYSYLCVTNLNKREFSSFNLYDNDSFKDVDKQSSTSRLAFQPQHKDHVMDRPSVPGQAPETPGGV